MLKWVHYESERPLLPVGEYFLMETDFVSIYLEPIQGDRLRLKKTKVKKTIDFRSVFGPDAVVEQKAKGRANEYTLSPKMDMELCHFSG